MVKKSSELNNPVWRYELFLLYNLPLFLLNINCMDCVKSKSFGKSHCSSRIYEHRALWWWKNCQNWTIQCRDMNHFYCILYFTEYWMSTNCMKHVKSMSFGESHYISRKYEQMASHWWKNCRNWTIWCGDMKCFCCASFFIFYLMSTNRPCQKQVF